MLLKLPPLVKTNRKPADIIGEIMNFSEVDVMVKHLAAYQKTHDDWDKYRIKIKPPSLLDKWKEVLNRCRGNGFIAPRVYNDELKWKQIQGFKRNYQNVDNCTLCSRSQLASDCSGKVIPRINKKEFHPCWEVVNG